MGYYDYEYDPPEIPEYLMQIDEIIAQEVQRQVEASNADIQALREKEALWIEKTNKLQEDLRKANLAVGEAAGKAKQAEEALQKELARKHTETVKEAFDGWDEAHEAYIVRSYDTYITCPICNDHKQIVIEHQGTKLASNCPLCCRYRAALGYKSYEVKPLWTKPQYRGGKLYLRFDDKVGFFPCYESNNSSYYSNDFVNLNFAYRSKEEAAQVATTKKEASRKDRIEAIYRIIKEQNLVSFLPDDDPRKEELSNNEG